MVLGLASTAAHALPERLSLDPADAVARLQANAGGELLHQSTPRSGFTMLRAAGHEPLMADGGAGSPEDRARFFLSVYGLALGMENPSGAIGLQRTSHDAAGNTHVHLDQYHDGLPVFGARIVVHMNHAGIFGVSGVYLPNLRRVSTDAPAATDALSAAALRAVRKEHPGRELAVAGGRWVIFPVGLLQDRLRVPRLAYEVTVRGGADLKERVFVDARSGAELYRLSDVHHLRNREIYTPDTNGPPNITEGQVVPPAPTDPALWDDRTDAANPVPSVVPNPPNQPEANLYIFAGGTYALYMNLFGRDGYDMCETPANGTPCRPGVSPGPWSPVRDESLGQIQKSVHLINQNCPNAYWNGDSTNYCPGFDADDVVSHEWSHGYTQFTHGLLYAEQSGALNESYSDIFGEAYDLVNDLERPLDAFGAPLEENKYYEDGGNRWVVGEDLSKDVATFLLRDMWKPEHFEGDFFSAINPGKVSSSAFDCAGEVHYNSSIPNHAFAMLVDGTKDQGPPGTTGFERDSYNGQSWMPGIGMTKAAHIYFHAENNYQTPTTNFAQHAIALEQSCQDLKGIDLNGLVDGQPTGRIIDQADCDKLHKAMLATEMGYVSPNCVYAPVIAPEAGAPALCPAGTPNTILTENWESGAFPAGWTLSHAAGPSGDSFPDTDWEISSDLPAPHTGKAAFAPDPASGGTCQPGGDISGSFALDSPTIEVPPGVSRLAFSHFMQTEKISAGPVDGGNLQYSVNGGAFAIVPAGAFIYGPHSRVLLGPADTSTNPKGGEDAWGGTDGGEVTGSWGMTIVDIAELAAAGDDLKFRWDFGQDGCNGNLGWYVDTVNVVGCPVLDPPVLSLGADYEDPDTDGSFTLNWTHPGGAVGPDLLQVSTAACAPLLTDDASALDNWTQTRSDPVISPQWTTSSTKPQHEGNSALWANPTSEQETQNSSASIAWNDPIALPAGANTLRFSEFYFNEDDDKALVEVSTDDGANWTVVYQNNRPMGSLPDSGAAAVADEDLSPVEVDLTPYSGQTIRLRFNFVLGESNFFFFTQYGWYVDDISIVNDSWGDVLTTSATGATLASQPDGERCYRVRTAYSIDGVLQNSPFSNIVDVTVASGITNFPPVANAGADQVKDEGTAVTLNGSASTDPELGPLTYAWEQTGGPAVTLSSTTAAMPTFTAPDVATDSVLTFKLTVTDNGDLSDDDTVSVNVLNEPGPVNPGGGGRSTGSNTTLGGALSPWSLLLLGVPALRRRYAGRAAAVLAALVFSGAASALPERASSDANDALARLRANAGGRLMHDELPASAFAAVRAKQGGLLMADGAILPPGERALFFLSIYGAALRIDDPAGQLVLQRISRDAAGNTHAHLDQVHDGVPVFGARIVVHMNARGIYGVAGVFVPGLKKSLTEGFPDITALRAKALADASGRYRGAALTIAEGRVVVYPMGLLQANLRQSRLAYEALVAAPGVRERVFVDVRTKVVVNKVDEIHRIKNREIYTPDQNVPPTYDEDPDIFFPAGPPDIPLIPDPGHNSTDPSDTTTPQPPVDNLWLFAGGTYTLYDNLFDRQGYDDCDESGPCQPDVRPGPWPRPDPEPAGQLQKSIYLVNEACPNAYWNGDATHYCPGFDADDVVSHEWSHGYTQFTHGLIYAWQSGALNESYSDIFGETYDLVNNMEGPLGGATLEEHKYYHEGGSRWVVGEDLSEEAAALLLRDMWDPEGFPTPSPGRVSSPDYACGSGDGGGVHTNSGVPNHAYAMLVDGKTYNDITVPGIGLIKAAHIYFQAESHYQTPTSGFFAHANALQQSCEDLLGVDLRSHVTGQPSGQVLTQADCDALGATIAATEMRDSPLQCGFQPLLNPLTPEGCGADLPQIYEEDWETGMDGWTVGNEGVNPEWPGTDWTLNPGLPDNPDDTLHLGTAAFAINPAIGEPNGGACEVGDDVSGHFWMDSPEIVIPEDAADLKVTFEHFVQTETDFDGGNLKVSTNGGAWTVVPNNKYLFNPPNFANSDTANTNPLVPEPVWSGSNGGESVGGWGTTIVDLAGLAQAGDTVKLRFDFGQDGCNGNLGWFIDKVRVLQCALAQAEGQYIRLHMHGNPAHDAGHPNEPDCTGSGAPDIIACDGPFLSTSTQLPDAPAAHWDSPNPALDGTNPRTIYDPSWVWTPAEPTVLVGPMRLNFWASCGACADGVSDADWDIRMYFGGSLVLDQRVTATPLAAGPAFLLRAEIPIPVPLVASGQVILHIDPVYAATQENTHIYYDSILPCTADAEAEACDSWISFGDLPPDPVGTICEAPGLSILADQAGDILVPIGQTSNEAWDIRKLSASQPFFDNGDYKIAFHLKVEDLTVMPQNTAWPINFCSPAFPCVNPDVNTRAYGADNKYYTVRMVSPGSDNPGTTPIFQILQPTAGGNTVGTRTLIPADPSSGYTPDGNITIVVNAADIGLNPANAGVEMLTKFQVRVRVGSDASGGTTPDNMPDGLAGDGQFQTAPLMFCAPNAAPIATLAVDPASGVAPLDVQFTIGGSDDDGDALVSYTLDFDDGTVLTDQAFGGLDSVVLAHQYADPGTYTATLTIKDAADRVSAAVTTQVTVTQPDVPPVADAGDGDTFVEGTPGTLDGTGSFDADGQTLSYSWAQLSGPAITLTGATTATPAFTAPAVCGDQLAVFELTVTTATGSDTDQVTLIIQNVNTLPVAHAGEDFTVEAGHDGMLSASADDPDCETLTYHWEQTFGEAVVLSDANSAMTSFTAPATVGEVLRFRVTVTDGANLPRTDAVLVTVVEDPIIGDNSAGGLGWLTLAGLGLGVLTRRRRTSVAG